MYIHRNICHVYTSKYGSVLWNKTEIPKAPPVPDGKFETDYSDSQKRLRSIRLTDEAWEKLYEIAEKNHITRSEVIEIFTRGGELY